MATIVRTNIAARRLGIHAALRSALDYLAEKIDTVLASGDYSTELRMVEASISAANIVKTTAGGLSHTSGFPVVPAPGTGKYLEFVSAVLVYDYTTAAYTGGGDDIYMVNTSGNALTAACTKANSFTATADKCVQFASINSAAVPIVANAGINILATTALTQPGTAAGTARIRVYYREHTL